MATRARRRDPAPTVPWRTLDPGTAARSAQEGALEATVYDPRRLLVGGLRSGRAAEAIDVVIEAAKRHGARVVLLDDGHDAKGRPIPDRGALLGDRDDEVRAVLDRTWVTRVELLPAEDDRAGAAPDAWEVVQEVRSLDRALGRQVSLNHLVLACAGPDWTGHGIWGSHPLWNAGGIWGSHPVGPATTYADPGSGGRMPVHLTVSDPYAPAPGRRPVVAVLDTGVGDHPWFRHGIRPADSIQVDAVTVGTADVDRIAAVDDVLEGQLTSHIGHGTFIAGLIRQGCPQADVLNLPVLDAHGSTDDATVIQTLSQLAAHQVRALSENDPARLVDVVSLSLGYYHERPEDLLTDETLRPALVELATLGIAIVAAAGNDATSRMLIPAGFAASVTEPVPVTSVGALNPGAATKALFSNDGTWVSCHRAGAALVSTMPTDLQGSLHQVATTPGLGAPGRSTLDPDDFSSGFGVWSGTSFAAPLLAAEVAAILGSTGLAGADVTESRTRTAAAVEQARSRTTGRGHG